MPSLQEVDAYPVPGYLIPRIAEVNGRTQKEAGEMLREAKRMLFLCVVSDDSIAPSDIVDEAWHEMLMFTRFYKQFAEFIGGFIHHDPTPPEMMPILELTKQEKTGVWETSTYTKTKLNYKTYFGEEPSAKYWP